MPEKTLRITIEDLTCDQHDVVLEALKAAGVREDQFTAEEGTGTPAGPALWLAVLLYLAVVALLLLWIWGGEWRWGATAGVLVVIATISFGLSISTPRSTTS